MVDLVTLREPRISLSRDIPAVEVPAGIEVTLVEGTSVSIVQELGGDFTIKNPLGYMYRVSGMEAGALGKEVPAEALPPDLGDKEVTEELIWDQLRKCYDPEIPVNIAELGLIYEVSVKPSSAETSVFIKRSLTAPGCGMGQVLMDDVKRKVEQISKVNASVELTFDPPWTPERMSEEARLTTGLM